MARRSAAPRAMMTAHVLVESMILAFWKGLSSEEARSGPIMAHKEWKGYSTATSFRDFAKVIDSQRTEDREVREYLVKADIGAGNLQHPHDKRTPQSYVIKLKHDREEADHHLTVRGDFGNSASGIILLSEHRLIISNKAMPQIKLTQILDRHEKGDALYLGELISPGFEIPPLKITKITPGTASTNLRFENLNENWDEMRDRIITRLDRKAAQ